MVRRLKQEVLKEGSQKDMAILKATLADSRAQLDMTVRYGAGSHCYFLYSAGGGGKGHTEEER